MPRGVRLNRAAILAALKEQYKQEGEMTLRRCWYVLLGKGLVHEHPDPQNLSQRTQPYRYLSQILLEARINGELDWNVIVDRTRSIMQPSTWTSVGLIIKAALDQFRYNAMENQESYVEVWVEKDAVSSYVYNSTEKWFVPLVVEKGFSSGTYLHDAADRLNKIEKPITILYLSDYDAEGEYFPKLFAEQVPERYHCEAKLEIKKLALTKPQIKKWKLPWIWIPKPKPEHMKKKYVSDYWKENGQQKVELDAVSGVKLTNLIEKRLGKILDWSIVEQSEEQSKSAVSKWKEQHGID